MKTEEVKKYEEARNTPICVGSRVWDIEVGMSATVLGIQSGAHGATATLRYDDDVESLAFLSELITLP